MIAVLLRELGRVHYKIRKENSAGPHAKDETDGVQSLAEKLAAGAMLGSLFLGDAEIGEEPTVTQRAHGAEPLVHVHAQ